MRLTKAQSKKMQPRGTRQGIPLFCPGARGGSAGPRPHLRSSHPPNSFSDAALHRHRRRGPWRPRRRRRSPRQGSDNLQDPTAAQQNTATESSGPGVRQQTVRRQSFGEAGNRIHASECRKASGKGKRKPQRPPPLLADRGMSSTRMGGL